MTQPIVERFITQGRVVENKKDALPPKTLCRAQYEICTVGKKNRNNRIYEKAVWEKVLQDKEILEKLKNKSMFFHAEHPTTTQSSGEKIAGVVTGITINENDGKVSATMDVLETPYGQIVDTLLQAGCGIGVSTRADGELEEAIDEAGQKYSRVVPESYRFVTVDFTADPSNFGSELPMTVQRNVTNAIKAGLDNEKIDRQYATVLLEHLTCVEAGTILESLKIDQHHEGCKCKPTEKACTKCPHAIKETMINWKCECGHSAQASDVYDEKVCSKCKKKMVKESKIKEDVKCPQCQAQMVGYKDGVICPQCGTPEQYQEEPQVAANEVKPAHPSVWSQEGAVPPVGNESIKKVGSEWQVTSKKGKNLGRYKSKAEAHKRLGQVEYFKHKNESDANDFVADFAKKVLAKQQRGEVLTDKEKEAIQFAFNAVDQAKARESKVNEVEFTNLDSVLSSDAPMSLEDLVAAVKLSMSAEFDATELYKKIAQATDNEMAKKVMQSIADEESVHAGEFRKLIATLQPGEEKLEDKGEKEAADVMGAKNESLLKPGHKVKYQGKEYTVKSVDEEDMLVELDSGFGGSVTVSADEIEDFLTEEVTSSDTSGQPADAKAAEEVMKKSEKRNKEVDEGTGWGKPWTVKVLKQGGDTYTIKHMYRDHAVNHRVELWKNGTMIKHEEADFHEGIENEYIDYVKSLGPVKEDVQLEIEIDPKVEQFLQDNWAQFVDDEDKVNNLVKLFKITPAKAKEYVDKVANGKATMSAVYTMAEAAWQERAEKLESTNGNLKTVIETLNEEIATLKEKLVYRLQAIDMVKESRKHDALDLKKMMDQLSESKKKLHEESQAKQSLVAQHEKQINELKEQHNRNLIKFYVDARTKAIQLKVSSRALTILESCGSTEEVDSEIRRLQNEIREAALQSNVPTEIHVTKTVPVSPVMQDINNKVAKAFRSFGA